MPEKKSSLMSFAPRAYLFVGITFLVVGVVAVFTSLNAMWPAFFALGMVFLILSFTQRAAAAKASETPEAGTDSPGTS